MVIMAFGGDDDDDAGTGLEVQQKCFETGWWLISGTTLHVSGCKSGQERGCRISPWHFPLSL